MPLFETTIAGSLPKPAWLAEPNRLWAPWRLSGEELAAAKRDATVLALKLQEDYADFLALRKESPDAIVQQHYRGLIQHVFDVLLSEKIPLSVPPEPVVTGNWATSVPDGTVGDVPLSFELVFDLLFVELVESDEVLAEK